MKTRSDVRRFRSEKVRGEPFRVAGRTLVPVARVLTYGRARATVGTHRLAGQGWGLVHVTPLAILDQTSGRQRRVPIRDATSQALLGMLFAAVALSLLLAAFRGLLRCSGPRAKEGGIPCP